MKKVLFVLIFSVFLSGCVSLQKIPLDYTDLKEDKATVYVYTPTDIPLDIYLDDELIGEVSEDSYMKSVKTAI